MNPHLKQLWAAMRLPENFKKSYKFFCRGLDIRVSKVVKANVPQTVLLQQLAEIGGNQHLALEYRISNNQLHDT